MEIEIAASTKPSLFLALKCSLKITKDNNELSNTIPTLFIPKTRAPSHIDSYNPPVEYRTTDVFNGSSRNKQTSQVYQNVYGALRKVCYCLKHHGISILTIHRATGSFIRTLCHRPVRIEESFLLEWISNSISI